MKKRKHVLLVIMSLAAFGTALTSALIVGNTVAQTRSTDSETVETWINEKLPELLHI